MVLEDRGVTIDEIANATCISHGAAHHILAEVSGFKFSIIF